jgi:predicted NAD/FAD-dependent oxidoreductase
VQDIEEEFDAVVVAIPAAQAARLLNGLIDTAGLEAFNYEPITTCYLQYDPGVALDHAFYALVDDARLKRWGQFVFDRGQLDAAQAGLLAVVVSTSTEAIAMGHDVLAASIARQLAEVFARPALSTPQWTKVISEKRATFSCTPGLQRPLNVTGLDGLVLAGDYTASDYPATLEAAVRSGVQAGRAIKLD